MARKRKKRRKLKPGQGPWKGTKTIVEQEIVPVLENAGVPITSRKRWTSFGNWASDHWRGNRDAYAVDGGTANNTALKNRVYRKLARKKSGTIDDYEAFYFTRSGRRYRGQLIAGTHGTGPHLHCGVKLA